MHYFTSFALFTTFVTFTLAVPINSLVPRGEVQDLIGSTTSAGNALSNAGVAFQQVTTTSPADSVNSLSAVKTALDDLHSQLSGSASLNDQDSETYVQSLTPLLASAVASASEISSKATVIKGLGSSVFQPISALLNDISSDLKQISEDINAVISASTIDQGVVNAISVSYDPVASAIFT